MFDFGPKIDVKWHGIKDDSVTVLSTGQIQSVTHYKDTNHYGQKDVNAKCPEYAQIRTITAERTYYVTPDMVISWRCLKQQGWLRD
jgi:hypothetical protein